MSPLTPFFYSGILPVIQNDGRGQQFWSMGPGSVWLWTQGPVTAHKKSGFCDPSPGFDVSLPEVRVVFLRLFLRSSCKTGLLRPLKGSNEVHMLSQYLKSQILDSPHPTPIFLFSPYGIPTRYRDPPHNFNLLIVQRRKLDHKGTCVI